jgi:hypothetical protein
MLVHHDRMAAIFLMAFAGSAFAYADTFPAEAAMYPRLVSGLMVLLSGTLFVRSFLPGFRNQQFEPLADDWVRLLSAAVTTFIFFLAAGWIGFYFAAAVFVPTMAILGGYRKLPIIALTTAIYLVATYLVFEAFFGRSLAPGLFDRVTGLL